jgi:hypothetical protein
VRFSFNALADHLSIQLGQPAHGILLTPRDNLQLWFVREGFEKSPLELQLLAIIILDFTDFDDWNYLSEILGEPLSEKIREFQEQAESMEVPSLDEVSDDNIEKVLRQSSIRAEIEDITPHTGGLILAALDSVRHMHLTSE